MPLQQPKAFLSTAGSANESSLRTYASNTALLASVVAAIPDKHHCWRVAAAGFRSFRQCHSRALGTTHACSELFDLQVKHTNISEVSTHNFVALTLVITSDPTPHGC
jgi:hypothetical protein